MTRTLCATIAMIFATTSFAQDGPNRGVPDPATPKDRRYIACIIGISTYANLPDDVELDFARSDAALLKKTLLEHAGFDQVFLVTDKEATQTNIRQTLRNEVAQLVGPDDVFLFYFAGHGIGADLGIPTLLAHDSTLQNGQEDGLELQAFARDLQTWTQAGTTVVVTDAIHRNQLDGIYFYGPAANQWPAVAPGTMVISSSQAAAPSEDGTFGKVFTTAIAGAADNNRDNQISAAELFAFLVNHTSPLGQIPVAAGDFDGDMVIAEGMSGGAIQAQEPVYPDHEIWSAKFVFNEGGAHSVHCREAPIKSCEPSCYVRDFIAGPCHLSAIVDGAHIEGTVIALVPGRYDCGIRDGELVCTPPRLAEPPRQPQ